MTTHRQHLTVIYYTSNRETPNLEASVQKHLLETIGNTPLISVSQKPIDLGRNICVGDVGVSSQNAYRQLLIGAMAATTQYVCQAEADYFHPTEYFEFVPPRDDTFYMMMPLWVLMNQRRKARVFLRKHRGSEAFMVADRHLLIDRLEVILSGLDMWGTVDARDDRMPYLLERRHVKREYTELPRAAITFITDSSMHRRTPHDRESATRELPGWGKATDVLARYTGTRIAQ